MEHLAGGFAINLAELSVKQADFVCIRKRIHNPHKLIMNIWPQNE